MHYVILYKDYYSFRFVFYLSNSEIKQCVLDVYPDMKPKFSTETTNSNEFDADNHSEENYSWCCNNQELINSIANTKLKNEIQNITRVKSICIDSAQCYFCGFDYMIIIETFIPFYLCQKNCMKLNALSIDSSFFDLRIKFASNHQTSPLDVDRWNIHNGILVDCWPQCLCEENYSSLLIPSVLGIKRINKNAFMYDIGDEGPGYISIYKGNHITAIVFGKGVEVIEEDVFGDKHWQSVTVVVLPPSIKEIHHHAFYGCKTPSVYIPSNNILIHKEAFGGDPVFYLYT